MNRNSHTSDVSLPSDEDILEVLRRRGCLSLRVLGQELWPDLGWRPPGEGEDSVAEGAVGERGTRALWLWHALGRLMGLACVQIAGADPDEVDPLAAVAFELIGRN